MKHHELRAQNSPPLRRQRAGQLAVLVASSLLMLGAALPTAADSVSNLSLTSSKGLQITENYPIAQGFTTGNHSAGYTLQSVTLTLAAQSDGVSWDSTVALYSASSVDPGASLATLTLAANQPTLGVSLRNFVFNCSSGCQLSGEGTSYFIVLAASRSGAIYWGQNSSGSETNTPANAGWSIADDAKYQNGNGGLWKSEGAVKLMTVTYEAITPNLWVENIRPTQATATLRNHAGSWSFNVADARQSFCRDKAQGQYSDEIGDLNYPLYAGKIYRVTAHSGHGCATGSLLDTETFTTPAFDAKFPELSVSNVGSTGATLSIANHSGDWWYLETADKSSNACKKVNAGTSSVTLASLTANTYYAYHAYSAAGCNNAAVPLTWVTDKLEFNTLGSVTATVTDHSDSWATLAVTGFTEGKWSYWHIHYPVPGRSDIKQISVCTTLDYSTASLIVTGLKSGTAYDFEVFRGESCSINERVTVTAHTFQLSAGQVGSTSAKLTLEHHQGNWHHKQVGGGQGASATGIRPKSSNGCSTAVSGTTADLDGLTPSTEYTWEAYKSAGCTGDAIASTTFTTLAEGQSPPSEQGTAPPVNVGGGGGSGSAPRTPEVRPEVTGLALASDPGPDFRYEAGDEVVIEATFSEPVRALNEHIELALSIGGEARTANYVGGSESDTLKFNYMVGPEDRDLDGIGFPADALKANFGRIHSLGGLASPLDIGEGALPATTGHRVGPPPSVPLLPAAGNASGRQGFVRVISHSAEAGEVAVTAFDDTGTKFGPVTMSIGANASAHFNATDLEAGNAAKGLAEGIGSGVGDWRLEFGGAPAVEAIGYVRHSDGFLTAVQDVAPQSAGVHSLATFNPASNHNQVSRLRIVNLGQGTASVKVTGVDDAGLSPGGAVELSLPAGAAEVCDAPELESGTGLSAGLGDGSGKWRLSAEADGPVEAMGLMESPSGHLTNLSTSPSVRHGDALVVPLFLSASDPHGRQGFVRVINRSDEAGRVYIKARDDSGRDHSQMELRIGANAVVHLNSDDLEVGASAKGLKGSAGPASSGDWRLELTSGLDIEALAYVRHGDGFLTSMHDVAPSANGVHRVATFNPASNDRQRSLLRIVNLGTERAKVTITGIDGGGASPGTDVEVEVRAGRSLTLAASQLEAGGIGLKGALGDGASKWRLRVTSEQDIVVMSLLESPSGHLTNLSSRPLRAD